MIVKGKELISTTLGLIGSIMSVIEGVIFIFVRSYIFSLFFIIFFMSGIIGAIAGFTGERTLSRSLMVCVGIFAIFFTSIIFLDIVGLSVFLLYTCYFSSILILLAGVFD
ncbi:MAG: hypothetical protein ACFE9N_00990 [Promethearchaeota archaeon]